MKLWQQFTFEDPTLNIHEASSGNITEGELEAASLVVSIFRDVTSSRKLHTVLIKLQHLQRIQLNPSLTRHHHHSKHANLLHNVLTVAK
jgi:hypothetical protein